jgi:hypothetical protein
LRVSDGSMTMVIDATPSSADSLPPSASRFFSHYANVPSTTSSSLQRNLSLQANTHSFEASLTAAKKNKKQDGGMALAHALAHSAPQASQWKQATPCTALTTLTDTQYRIAARLNLGLQPLDPVRMKELPASCPNCNDDDSIINDGWHFLHCRKQQSGSGEISTRHHAVVNALHHSVMTVGGQAVREPKGLVSDRRLRPDLEIVFPGQHVLVDVTIGHPLTATFCKNRKALSGNAGLARSYETTKQNKYRQLTARQEATFFAFAAETCGGLAPDAMRLLKLISETAQIHLSLWPHHEIVRHMLGSVAVAIQIGNAMIVLSSYTNALAKNWKGGEEEMGQAA